MKVVGWDSVRALGIPSRSRRSASFVLNSSRQFPAGCHTLIPGPTCSTCCSFPISAPTRSRASLARQPLMRPNMLRFGDRLPASARGAVHRARRVTAHGARVQRRRRGAPLFRAGTTFATYFIVLAMARERGDRRRVTYAVLAGLVAESLVTVALGRNGSGARATGPGQATNGAYLALFSVVAFHRGRGDACSARRCSSGSGLLGSFAIILSLSRGSMLALLAGTVPRDLARRACSSADCSSCCCSHHSGCPTTSGPHRAVHRQTEAGISVDSAAEKRLETWQTIFKVVRGSPARRRGFQWTRLRAPRPRRRTGPRRHQGLRPQHVPACSPKWVSSGSGCSCGCCGRCFRLANIAAQLAKSAFDRALANGLAGAVCPCRPSLARSATASSTS